jgi:hypothetical protein
MSRSQLTAGDLLLGQAQRAPLSPGIKLREQRPTQGEKYRRDTDPSRAPPHSHHFIVADRKAAVKTAAQSKMSPRLDEG